jgi:hypothetical protein
VVRLALSLIVTVDRQRTVGRMRRPPGASLEDKDNKLFVKAQNNLARDARALRYGMGNREWNERTATSARHHARSRPPSEDFWDILPKSK